MIDQGIVQLVQSDATVLALCPAGGFDSELPKDILTPTNPASWTFRGISFSRNIGLRFTRGLIMKRIQIDCHGLAPANAIALGQAIDAVLNGFQGTLSDPDTTFVSSCFTSDQEDSFDDSLRSYRRMLEYEVWFAQEN